MSFSFFKEVHLSLTKWVEWRHWTFCLCFFELHMAKPGKCGIKKVKIIEKYKYKCEFKDMFQAST